MPEQPELRSTLVSYFPNRLTAHTAPSDRWSLAAWRGLRDDLDDLRHLTARRALDDHPEKNELDAVLRFLAARTSQVAEVNRLLRNIEADAHSSLDAVTVATSAAPSTEQ